MIRFFFLPMSRINNSQLLTRVFEALFVVVGRRTLDSFAVQIIKTTTEKLEKKFDFLGLITVHDNIFAEDKIKATIEPEFNTTEPSLVGPAIDALIRVIYIELIDTIGDDACLYFIREFKENLGNDFVDELRGIGINFEQIETEHNSRYQKKVHQVPTPPSSKKEELQPSYSWQSVSTWKYDNNMCLLYDESGRLLDTLQLDLIIEEYVERVTETKNQQGTSPVKTTMLKVTTKENELLEMMKRRDIDIESALALLHVSRQKFDSMIQKLLQLEMLQYVSDKEVKLTEKGLFHLSEHPKK